MEKFQELRQKARRNIAVADHMLTQTYPLVRDSKLLLLVLENIFLAMTNSMSSVLFYERLFKRIPAFENHFESKFNAFRRLIVSKHKIDNMYADVIQEIKEIIMQHKKSPIEFRRKDKFVICGSDYNFKTISSSDIKEYLKYAKDFLNIAESITKKEERIFSRY